MPMADKYVPRLQKQYFEEIIPQLVTFCERENVLSLPRLQKIVINMGVGSGVTEKKHVEESSQALTQIAGQKALVTRARKSIANFRLREGLAIGCKATLRRQRMYEFFDRLVSIAIPRVRDFRGLNPNGFDGHGNYSMGLTEQLVFPELNPDKFQRPQGMNITFVTSAQNDAEGRELLRLFGMPFKTDAKQKKDQPVGAA